MFPSANSNKSLLSLYPNYKHKDQEEKKNFNPRRSYNKALGDEPNRLLINDDSADDFKKPFASTKTLRVFGESKSKFSMVESQLSSISKAASRYDSIKSSESAEVLGVDLYETIHQIEDAYQKKDYSEGKIKVNAGRRRAKSFEAVGSVILDMSNGGVQGEFELCFIRY
jgi:hypothetical protein